MKNSSTKDLLFSSIVPPMEEAYVDWPIKDNPTYLPYDFEVINVTSSRQWMWQNWTCTLYISVFYVISIYLGQLFMRSRSPFNLRGILAIWNFGLALFSFAAFARVAPELLEVVTGHNGFYRSVCVRDGLNPSSPFWGVAFCVSKMVELLDTGFIVLRKTPLIFLHWYHHLATLVVSWMSFPQAEPIFRYVGSMNFFVHSVMYSYYGFKALKFKLPKRLSMAITALQLSQMVVGLILNFYAIHVKGQGIECARSYENIWVQMLIYASYLVLFANFFYKSYLLDSSKKFKGE